MTQRHDGLGAGGRDLAGSDAGALPFEETSRSDAGLSSFEMNAQASSVEAGDGSIDLSVDLELESSFPAPPAPGKVVPPPVIDRPDALARFDLGDSSFLAPFGSGSPKPARSTAEDESIDLVAEDEEESGGLVSFSALLDSGSAPPREPDIFSLRDDPPPVQPSGESGLVSFATFTGDVEPPPVMSDPRSNLDWSDPAAALRALEARAREEESVRTLESSLHDLASFPGWSGVGLPQDDVSSESLERSEIIDQLPHFASRSDAIAEPLSREEEERLVGEARHAVEKGIRRRNAQRANDAAIYFEKAAEIYRRLDKASPTKYRRDFAGTLIKLAGVRAFTGDAGLELAAVREALDLYRTIERGAAGYERRALKISEDLASLAHRNAKQNRYGQAEAEHFEELRILQELAATAPETYRGECAEALHRFARFYLEFSKFPHAEAREKQALELFRTLAAEEPGSWRNRVAASLKGLGKVAARSGKKREARQYFGEALAIFRELATESPETYESKCRRLEKRLRALAE